MVSKILRRPMDYVEMSFQLKTYIQFKGFPALHVW